MRSGRDGFHEPGLRQAGAPDDPGGGGLTSIQVEPRLKVSIVGSVAHLRQVVAATWTSYVRIFAIDPIDGDDSRAGYADFLNTFGYDEEVYGTEYGAACRAAGAVAKKTIAGLAAIFPLIGNGRRAEIVAAAGTYDDSWGVVLAGVSGYAAGFPLVRGTATNADAAVTKFDGSQNDVLLAGHVAIPSLNAAGYNAIGTPSKFEFQCQQVGGAAAGFAAAPAVPVGARIRFSATTVTVNLRNECGHVCHVAGTDTILLQRKFSAAPVPGPDGDVFFLEQPGVYTPHDWNISGPLDGDRFRVGAGVQLVGLHLWSADINFARINFASCWLATLSADDSNVTTGGWYRHPFWDWTYPGGGTRCEFGSFFYGGDAYLKGLSTAGEVSAFDLNAFNWEDGCSALRMTLSGIRRVILGGNNAEPGGVWPTWTPTPYGSARILGAGLSFGGSYNDQIDVGCEHVRIGDLVFEAGGIGVSGRNKIWFYGYNARTRGTGPGVGLDLSLAMDSVITFCNNQRPTLTGALGDIQYASLQGGAAGPIGQWANFDLEEDVWDVQGNHVLVTRDQDTQYGHSNTISPSVFVGFNIFGGAIPACRLVRGQAAVFVDGVAVDGGIKIASTDTMAHTNGLVGVSLNDSASSIPTGAAGSMVLVASLCGHKVLKFELGDVMKQGDIVYLGRDGQATNQAPAPDPVAPILRLGHVVSEAFGVGYRHAVVQLNPELGATWSGSIP